MANPTITVTTQVNPPVDKTWHYYTEAEHVINWNFPSDEWHCPRAVNDLREGGKFDITMAAKEGEMSFDLEGTYDEVEAPQHVAYTLSNETKVEVHFTEKDGGTKVKVAFEPDGDRSESEQKENWEGILGNFRKYVNGL